MRYLKASLSFLYSDENFSSYKGLNPFPLNSILRKNIHSGDLYPKTNLNCIQNKNWIMSTESRSIILHWIKYSNFENMSKGSMDEDTKKLISNRN